MSDKPKSRIQRQIFRLTLELHKQGYSRRDIVYWLREVADYTEDYWEDDDTYDKSPHEKNVVLSGDFED